MLKYVIFEESEVYGKFDLVIIKWKIGLEIYRQPQTRRSKEVVNIFHLPVGKSYFFKIFFHAKARHVPETCPPSGRQREAAFLFRPVAA